MYYVTMTDTFLSGWGEAENKIAKFVCECENLEEVDTVIENAKARGDQGYVRWGYKKPYYNSARYFVKYENKETCKNWYIKGYFNK